MDLKHDWKALNEVLFQSQNMASNVSTLVLLEDNNKVVEGVVSNGKAFTDFGVEGVSANKDKLDGMAANYGTDQAIVLSKAQLDQLISEAASIGSNYYQQLQNLREKALNSSGRARNKGAVVSRRHFVLDLINKVKRALPRRFNAVIFIDQRPSTPALSFMAPSTTVPFSYRAILLSYSDGQLDQFYEPDFSSLHGNRLVNWQQDAEAIGQYLETRYILPCYSLFMFQEDWERCLEAAQEKTKPWRNFARYYEDGRAAVYPRGMLTKALLASQRLMVYFSRLS